jgi:hypothetical protein
MDLAGSESGIMMGYCEHSNEPFYRQLGDYQVLKKDSARWNYLKG